MSTALRCPSCGVAQEHDAAFCDGCGASIVPASVPSPPAVQQAAPVSNLLSQPMTLEVKTSIPFSAETDYTKTYIGKGTLELSSTGMTLQVKKLLARPAVASVPWHQLRELNYDKLSKGKFTANLGSGNSDLPLAFKVRSGDLDALRAVFDGLPEDAKLSKCPACGGAVKDDICKGCGANPRAVNRQAALLTLGGGVVALAIGLGVSLFTYDSAARAGGTYFVMYGLVIVGAIAILKGLFNLVLGTKIGTQHGK